MQGPNLVVLSSLALAQTRPGLEWRCVQEVKCPESHPAPHSTLPDYCVGAAGNEAAIEMAGRPKWVNMDNMVAIAGEQHSLVDGQTLNWQRAWPSS